MKKKNNNFIKLKIGNKMEKFGLINDELRRLNQFKKLISNKKVLDFGCAFGKFIFLSKKHCKKIYGIELRKKCIEYLRSKKIKIKKKLDEFNDKFDVITMFHVLEHLPYQIDTLKSIHSKLKKGGKIIIEVPHGEDYLLNFEKLKNFKNFTFWSEHLILHTERSLKIFLKEANFRKIKIIYFQRYNYYNHLKWLIENKPGGHTDKNYFKNDKIIADYNEYLARIKKTDTIIAIAEK